MRRLDLNMFILVCEVNSVTSSKLNFFPDLESLCRLREEPLKMTEN